MKGNTETSLLMQFHYYRKILRKFLCVVFYLNEHIYTFLWNSSHEAIVY